MLSCAYPNVEAGRPGCSPPQWPLQILLIKPHSALASSFTSSAQANEPFGDRLKLGNASGPLLC